MKFIGVDGCKKGWFAVTLFWDSKKYEFGLYPTFAELYKQNSDSELILIDIPIGLPHDKLRECDLQARKMLGWPRLNSVFLTQSRAALFSSSYKEACEINFEMLGRKFSWQSWCISNKIREVDLYLRKHSSLQRKIRESHPEICFWGLAGKKPMKYKKKDESGATERLEILANYLPLTYEVFSKAIVQHPRKDVDRDDILDALVLALTASKIENLKTLPENPQRDSEDLVMEIVFTS